MKNKEQAESLIRSLLEHLGEDPDREGLARTPKRVIKAYDELTSGMNMTVQDAVGTGVFEEQCSEMILVRDIEFYSLCEHHMLPFYGRVHIGYIPRDKILGLSKLARITDVFARRLQVQERMTQEIANAVQEIIQPLGVGVVVDAAHFCMMMRGVQKQNSTTMTSCLLGGFRNDPSTRSEFLGLIQNLRS
ncbi:MAG: GTP cyclohydrolase I FolE [Planctomycetes bacterium]|nr:GTP cyclohydrolase I FolE [Planctomycetota bacterium]MCB9909646.1 GTP cyclohydrolase I FolE [Planctomycetota bacterium]MCB9911865.1 GTP cyclohydrolase I FolE [Planctomycetota bacterium]HRV82248.1 GTP cyclohydrolase I FolE [Planctomycetota bacterium]